MKIIMLALLAVLVWIAQNQYDKQPAQPKPAVVESTVAEKIEAYQKCMATPLSFLCAYPFSRSTITPQFPVGR